jgi:hypothetical protein
MDEDESRALLEAEVEALGFTYDESDHIRVSYDADQATATVSFTARPRGAAPLPPDDADADADAETTTTVPLTSHFIEADLKLVASAPQGYPSQPLVVRLTGARGLGGDRAAALVERLKSEAEALAAHGEPSLGLLVEQARDWATEADALGPEGDCPVCLEALAAANAAAAAGGALARLPCFHALHAQCFARWFRFAQRDLDDKARSLAERVRSSAAAAALERETLPPRDALGGKALRGVAVLVRRRSRRREEEEEVEEEEEQEGDEASAAAAISDPFRLDCPSCRAPFSVARVVAAKRRRGAGGAAAADANEGDGERATRALWWLLQVDGGGGGGGASASAAAADALAALELAAEGDGAGPPGSCPWRDAQLVEAQRGRQQAFERQMAAGGVIDESQGAGVSLDELAERQRREREQQRQREGEEKEREKKQQGQAQGQGGQQGGRAPAGRGGGRGGGGRGGGGRRGGGERGGGARGGGGGRGRGRGGHS